MNTDVIRQVIFGFLVIPDRLLPPLRVPHQLGASLSSIGAGRGNLNPNNQSSIINNKLIRPALGVNLKSKIVDNDVVQRRTSDCFDCRRRLGGYVVCNADDAGHLADNLASQLLKNFERQSCRCCSPGVEAVPTAHLYLLTEITLAVAHTGHAVFMKDGHVLKGAGIFEQPLDNHGCLAVSLDALGGHLAYHACRQRRAGERNPLEQLSRQPEGLAYLSDTVLAKLNQRLDDAVAERLLRVDADLLEDIVLSLDACDGFVDIGQDCSLEKVLR